VIDVQVTGAHELIADLDRAVSRAPGEVGKVVNKGALNIKTDWARRWSGLSHAPAAGASVTFDTYFLPGSARAEIGPDKGRRQGALGNLLEYGSVHNAPIPGGLPSLEAEAPRTERALSDLAERLLGGG
jgi:hypothetical protein